MTAWMDDAACKGMTDLFFPARGESTEPAKQICAACPVLDDCRTYILANDSWNGLQMSGVWGGMSGWERRRRDPVVRPLLRLWCVVCNKRFESASSVTLYCSKACRHVAIRRRRRLRIGEREAS